MMNMFSKLMDLGTGTSHQPPDFLRDNPIKQFFVVEKKISSAGPGLVWSIHDAQRKKDAKDCSVFVFQKHVTHKLSKPKREQSWVDRVRASVLKLEKFQHPAMLRVIHSLEEGPDTLAFASEQVLASLHHILSWHASSPLAEGAAPVVVPQPLSMAPLDEEAQPTTSWAFQPAQRRPPLAKPYDFINFELQYGLLQMVEALDYLHKQGEVHHNFCPQVIVICCCGTWKLLGLEFVETITGKTTMDVTVPLWSMKDSPIYQPNLDYMAPEVQMNGQCSAAADMFSLGLVICQVFNEGNPLVQANNNPQLYKKHMLALSANVQALFPRMPSSLRESVQRLCARHPQARPDANMLLLLNFFQSQVLPAIRALQKLDAITTKNITERKDFYQTQLMESLPLIPEKLRWLKVWPALLVEVRSGDMSPSVTHCILWLTNESTEHQFTTYILKAIVYVMRAVKSSEVLQIVLENMDIFLKKCNKDEANELLPWIYKFLEDTNNNIKISAVVALHCATVYIDDKDLNSIILARVRLLLDNHSSDINLVCLVLEFLEKVLTRMEKTVVLEQLIPTLITMRQSDPEIVHRIVSLYTSMLHEEQLNAAVMATKMIPALAPHSVDDNLSVDQYNNLIEIIYAMLGNIDESQRTRLLMLGQPQPEHVRKRALRQQSSDPPPPFIIPNLCVNRRHTSSAESMARTPEPAPSTSTGIGFRSTGIGQWFFGSNSNNFLRVINIPLHLKRRLSDNTVTTPTIRVAPSTPGGSPGGSAALPPRRHSSIGPQECRGSVNLTPPKAAGGSIPDTSSSVPFLLMSSLQSGRSRGSAAGVAHPPGSSLLQQISSGMGFPRTRPQRAAAQAPVWSPLQGAIRKAVLKCPSLNLTR